MLEGKRLGFGIAVELAMMTCVGLPVAGGSRFAHVCPFEIDAKTSRPLPGIMQIEHSPHVALAHFHHQIVESLQQGVVVLAWTGLHGRLYVVGSSGKSLCSNEYAQVCDTQCLQTIEFLTKSFTIASLSFTAQNGTIPEIGTDVAIGLIALIELSLANRNERRGGGTMGITSSDANNKKDDEC